MGLVASKDLIDNSEEWLGCGSDEVGIGWIAPHRELLGQAESDNAMISCPNVHYISMFDNDPMQHLSKYKVRIAICDEAHRTGCDTGVSMLNAIKPDRIIGLSATPMRTDKISLCFQTTINDAGIHRLIQDGWLAKYDQYMLQDKFTPENVAAAFLRDPSRWGQSVIYFLSESECRKCEGILRAGGVRCEVVTGSTDRDRQIADFKSGKLSVLLNMVILTEGFDYAEMSTVWIRDTDNRNVITQCGGRVLRPFEGMVKKIVQSTHSRRPFANIAKPNRQFLESGDQWLSIGMNDAVETVSRDVIRQLSSVRVDVPAFLMKKCKKEVWD